MILNNLVCLCYESKLIFYPSTLGESIFPESEHLLSPNKFLGPPEQAK